MGTSHLKVVLARDKFPRWFFALTLTAGLIQAHPGWRSALLYDRDALAHGEVWRIWSGHLVHFGWLHFIVDAGLFLILGRVLERTYPLASALSLAGLPVAIAAALYWFEPEMKIYAGLSGVNVGLLVFLACRGWQKDWTDWFWPAVLALHVGEVILEVRHGGQGGGAIRFDTPRIHVATMAHVAGALYGFLLWFFLRNRRSG